nr:PREDICTED: facilitated trehalose transporter Tret1-like [Bemisia tabaci]
MAEEWTAPPKASFLRSFLVAASMFPLYICLGALIGQSAGMLPQLLEEDSTIHINKNQATWIASLPTIGTCMSSAASGYLSDLFGRIRVVQAAYSFFAIGFATMMAADSFMLLALGRFLAGIGMGCYFSGNVYLSEVTPPKYRGALLTLNSVLCSCGLVYVYIVGGYYPWYIAAAATCLISIIGLTLTFSLYDSPVWLVRQNRLKTAAKSLRLVEISSNVETKLRKLQETAENHPKTDFTLKILTEPSVWKPFVMILVLSILQNTSGFCIIIAYTVQFMWEFHSAYDPLHVTVAIGVMRLLAILVSFVLFQHFGRKTIGAVSGFGAAIFLLGVYGYLIFAPRVQLLSENQWIPIVLFLAFIFTSSLGIYPLPWILPFELFPIKVRGMMCGACLCALYLNTFVAVMLYYVLIDNLRLGGTILLFAAGSALFGIFSMTLLVETHRRTLDDIECTFASGRVT